MLNAQREQRQPPATKQIQWKRSYMIFSREKERKSKAREPRRDRRRHLLPQSVFTCVDLNENWHVTPENEGQESNALRLILLRDVKANDTGGWDAVKPTRGTKWMLSKENKNKPFWTKRCAARGETCLWLLSFSFLLCLSYLFIQYFDIGCLSTARTLFVNWNHGVHLDLAMGYDKRGTPGYQAPEMVNPEFRAQGYHAGKTFSINVTRETCDLCSLVRTGRTPSLRDAML